MDPIRCSASCLRDPEIRDQAFTILRDLIQGVVVTPGPKRSFSVELVGEITKMIALPDDKATFDESSVKVVSWARNHLYRTFLELRKSAKFV